MHTSPVFFHHLLYSIWIVPFSWSSRMARERGSRHLEPLGVAIPYLMRMLRLRITHNYNTIMTHPLLSSRPPIWVRLQSLCTT